VEWKAKGRNGDILFIVETARIIEVLNGPFSDGNFAPHKYRG